MYDVSKAKLPTLEKLNEIYADKAAADLCHAVCNALVYLDSEFVLKYVNDAVASVTGISSDAAAFVNGIVNDALKSE